jgi:hypothetical protein
MTTDKFCFYLQNRLIQTSQTGGQLYGDAFPFSIPWTWVSSKDQTELEIFARLKRASLLSQNEDL